MIECSSCRQEIGMNRKCAECMHHMLHEGAKRMDEAGLINAAAEGRQWLGSGGHGAPGDLVKSTERLMSFLEGKLAGPKAVRTSEQARIAAFVIHYVVSPQDFAPDSIPGVGWSDDQFVVNLAIAELGHALDEAAAPSRKKRSK